MSILSDLAPEKSKPSPAATRNSPLKKLVWMFALLLLTGAGFWLYFVTQVSDASADREMAPPPIGAVAEPEPSAASQPAPTPDAPAQTASGSAIIRNEPPPPQGSETARENNVFQTLQHELQSPPTPAGTARNDMPVRQNTAEPVASRKQAAATQATPKQKQQATKRRNHERDIEIITAIVK